MHSSRKTSRGSAYDRRDTNPESSRRELEAWCGRAAIYHEILEEAAAIKGRPDRHDLARPAMRGPISSEKPTATWSLRQGSVLVCAWH